MRRPRAGHTTSSKRRGARATFRPRSFEPQGAWTIIELIQASAEVWVDLAEVEDDPGIAAGYRAMAKDLEGYADALLTRPEAGGCPEL